MASERTELDPEERTRGATQSSDEGLAPAAAEIGDPSTEEQLAEVSDEWLAPTAAEVGDASPEELAAISDEELAPAAAEVRDASPEELAAISDEGLVAAAVGIRDASPEELAEIESLDDDTDANADAPEHAALPPPPLPSGRPRPSASVGDTDGAAREHALPGEPGAAEGDGAAADSAGSQGQDARAIETATVLDRLLEEPEEGVWERRGQELETALAEATDHESIAAIAHELGELCEHQLASEARAVRAYGRALKGDPSLRANLWAIRRIFYRRALWPNLVKLIDAEIRFARDDNERADLHVEAAHLFEDRLDDRDAARAACEKALACDPASLPALLGLERIALATDDDDALERAWRALADVVASPPRKLDYLLDIAELRAARGGEGDLARARAAVAEAVELGEDVRGAEYVARLRERLAERCGDAAEMLAALESRIGHLLAECGGAQARYPIENGQEADPAAFDRGRSRAADLRLQVVALRRRQARIARDRAGDPERAWTYLEQALALAGSEPLVLADLADLAEQLGRYRELAELCQGWESLEGDPVRSLSLSIRRAEALLRGGQRDEARALLAQLSSATPGYLPVVALLERDCLAEGDMGALAAVYVAAAEAAQRGELYGPEVQAEPDRAGAAANFVLAGELYGSHLERAAEALAFYERALDVVPGYPPAVDAIVALHQRNGQLREAAQFLERFSDHGTAVQRRSNLERLAQVYGDLSDDAALLGTLHRLLALDPDDVRLRWRIDEALARTGRAGERVEVLVELANRTLHADGRASVLLRAARLADAMGDFGRAVQLYHHVLEIWPGDRYARAALTALLRRGEKWEELVAVRRSEADQLAPGPAFARALREAAWVLHHRLGRRDQAGQVYRELLDHMPHDRAALRALGEVYLESGDIDGAAEVLASDAQARIEPRARAAALLRFGAAWERAGNLERAQAAYQEAAELAPAGALAPVAMAEAAARLRDPIAWAEAMDLLAQRRDEPRLASEVLEEVAWSWALEGQDLDRADAAFRAAAEADGGRRGPIFGLALVNAQRGDTAEVGDALAALAATVHGAYAASSLYLRAAALAEAGGDAELAGRRVEHAVALAPDDAGTVVAAAEYLPAGPSDELPAEGAVAKLLKRASLLGLRAQLASDPVARQSWELDQAEALEAAGRLRDAAEIVASVLARQPDDVRALQALRRICRRGGDKAAWGRASFALGRTIGDRSGKLPFLREAAQIFDQELGETDNAAAAYQRILGEDPGADEYYRLHTIYREQDDGTALCELIGDRLRWLNLSGGAAPADTKISLLFDRARARARAGDAAGAAQDASSVLEINPDHSGALSLLAALRDRAGAFEEAAVLLRRFLTLERDPEARKEAELTLSRILADTMEDIEGALEHLARVVEQSPKDEAVRERYAGLLGRAGHWDSAADQLRALAHLRSNPAARAADLLRIAHIYRDELNDIQGAREVLEEVRQHDPLHIGVVRQLADLFPSSTKRLKLLRQAVADLRRAIAADPKRASLYERLAHVADWLGERDVRYFALEALEALGQAEAADRAFVAGERQARRQTPLPRHPLGASWDQELAHPQGGGIAAELWRLIAAAASERLALGPGRLGFARSDRVRNVAKNAPEVAAVADCFGIADFELYVSAGLSSYARVVGADRPTVYLSADVARPRSAEARFSLGRALAQARVRIGTLAELREEEVVVLFASALRVAGIEKIPSGLAEVTAGHRRSMAQLGRELERQMGRRERKALAAASDELVQLGDPIAWRRAALATSWRAGLLVAGDLSATLEMIDVGRGGRSLLDDEAALELLSWAVSTEHSGLRKRLGLSRDAP